LDLTVYYNGELLRDSEIPFSIYDHGLLFGDGARIDIRIYRKKPFALRRHLANLAHSVEKLGIPFQLTEKTIEKTIRVLLDLNSFQEAMATVLVTRGPGQMCLDANLSLYPTVCIMTLPPLEVDKRYTYEGVSLILSEQRAMPPQALDRNIFSISRQQEIVAHYEAHHKNAFEALLINLEGQVAEGACSNVFLVQKGQIMTPDLSCGVRPRVMRDVVMELGRRMGYSVVAGLISASALQSIDECFIVNTEWEILPVVKIEGQPVADGRPGKITNHLMEGFKILIRSGHDGEDLTPIPQSSQAT
jgi:branched-chain amino acid aminotransferase